MAVITGVFCRARGVEVYIDRFSRFYWGLTDRRGSCVLVF